MKNNTNIFFCSNGDILVGKYEINNKSEKNNFTEFFTDDNFKGIIISRDNYVFNNCIEKEKKYKILDDGTITIGIFEEKSLSDGIIIYRNKEEYHNCRPFSYKNGILTKLELIKIN